MMARVFECFAADYGDLLRRRLLLFVMCFQWYRDWLFITCLFVSFSDLSNNQITSIAGDAFHGLKSLTSL